jgi:filamentous hemagglutinin
MAELKQARLGRLAGGVDGVNAAATTTGAAQDIDAEGVLMSGPFSVAPTPQVDNISINIKRTKAGVFLWSGGVRNQGRVAEGGRGIDAVVSGGTVGFDVRAFQSVSGTDLVLSVLGRLKQEGIPYSKLRGTWLYKGDSVNGREFLQNLRTGMTPAEAAENTWTGRLFTRLGYVVESVESTGTEAKVLFRQSP